MARPKKKTDETVKAFTAPDVDHDTLIDFTLARNAEDAKRASDAGETRQAIGAFIDKTNLHPKAYAQARAILKQAAKHQGKAVDWIRSLKHVLPMVESHITGQGTLEMDLKPVDPMDPPAEARAHLRPVDDDFLSAVGDA